MRRLLLLVAACGAAAKPTPPAIRLVETARYDVAASAVIEQGDAVFVLAGTTELIIRGGIVLARVESDIPWGTGASIAAPDGDGRWVVGIDAKGNAWHLTLSGEKELVSERLHLNGIAPFELYSVGSTFVANAGESIHFTTDGMHVSRVSMVHAENFAVARGEFAFVNDSETPSRLERWNLARGTRTTYPIIPQGIAFLNADTDHARLVVTVQGVVWAESKDGKLVSYPMPERAGPIRANRDRVWIQTDSNNLFIFDGEHIMPTTNHHPVKWLATASTTGDIWLRDDKGLVRYATSSVAADPLWQSQVAPVFQRVCSHCHLPGGEAGIDLSTPPSWASERDEIRRRVLVTRTMPPAGTDLSDADRAALEHWLSAPR